MDGQQKEKRCPVAITMIDEVPPPLVGGIDGSGGNKISAAGGRPMHAMHAPRLMGKLGLMFALVLSFLTSTVSGKPSMVTNPGSNKGQGQRTEERQVWCVPEGHDRLADLGKTRGSLRQTDAWCRSYSRKFHRKFGHQYVVGVDVVEAYDCCFPEIGDCQVVYDDIGTLNPMLECYSTVVSRPRYEHFRRGAQDGIACIGNQVNETWLAFGGSPLQSETEYSMLLEYFDNPITGMARLDAMCNGERSMEALPGCQEDTYACVDVRGVEPDGYDYFDVEFGMAEGEVHDFHAHMHNTGSVTIRDPSSGASLSANTAENLVQCKNFHGDGTEWNRPVFSIDDCFPKRFIIEATWSGGFGQTMMPGVEYRFPAMHIGGIFNGWFTIRNAATLEMDASFDACTVFEHRGVVSGYGDGSYCTLLVRSLDYDSTVNGAFREVCDCDIDEPEFGEGEQPVGRRNNHFLSFHVQHCD